MDQNGVRCSEMVQDVQANIAEEEKRRANDPERAMDRVMNQSQTMSGTFDAAIRTLTDDRGDAYGHPLDNFADVAAGWDILAQRCADPEVRVALCLAWLKLCRIAASPDHQDSINDLAGYARTIAMIHDKRRS